MLGFFACAGEEAPPRWVALARGFRPQPLLPLVQRWQREAGLDADGCTEEEGAAYVRARQPMPPSVWERGGEPDTWTAALPGGAFAYGSPAFLQLRSESAKDLRIVQSPAERELAPNFFRLGNGRMVLRLAEGAAPPADLYVTQRMETGRLPADGVWEVRVGDDFGAGIPVWTGVPEEIPCAVPAASALSFEARFRSRWEGKVTLRVRLDGAVVHESVEDTSGLLAPRRFTIHLPPAERAEAHLRLEVDGPAGLALFLHPVIGPAEIGSYGARPWKDARPDIVLLLADTFRADNLAVGGGAGDLAPALDRFAGGGLRFRNARSNAAWTLPSISTLLTGLAPGQHTANSIDHALPDGISTMAEALARSGYRTCAVTDAAFFTPTYGLEQGFESFTMRPSDTWNLDATVERALAFLEQDDGRPLFLLVHSYRTHMPYRTGPEEDLRPWKEFLASGCALLRAKGHVQPEEWRTRLARCKERLQALYREGVRDLDRGFGELVAGLERRGLGRGFLIFTSDHGEALGENEDVFHDGKLWESKLRIPLVVRGPRIEPRDSDVVVTLLDLAPTLAEIAGLPRDPAWSGESLLSVAHDRPACAFLLKNAPEVTVFEGGHKLFASGAEELEAGTFTSAFDLARDPHEDSPVTEETWPAELARRRAALVRALLVPASEPLVVPLTGAQERELEQLGYGGEGNR